MRILFFLCFILSSSPLFAYFQFELGNPIERNKIEHQPMKENIEASPYLQRCLTRLEAKPFEFRTPKGTERFTLEQCVRFEEKFNGLR